MLARAGIVLALLAAFGAWCWLQGDVHGTQKLYDYQGKELKQEVKVKKAREIVTEKVVTKYIKVKGETQVVTETIEKEVIRYENSTNCLDAEWRRLHDAAALNRVPESGRDADGEGGAPTASASIQTVTANYAACNKAIDRLDALQDWVRKQRKVR